MAGSKISTRRRGQVPGRTKADIVVPQRASQSPERSMDESMTSNKARMVAKEDSRKERKEMYRKCLAVMKESEDEFHQALAEKDTESAKLSREIQRLHAEMAQDSSKLQQVTMEKEKVSSEAQRLEKELREAQQHMQHLNTNMHGQTLWHEIQPALQQTQGEIAAANSRLWNIINNPQSGQLVPYPPGSQMMIGSWANQGPPANPDYNLLPEFPA